jgi:hypothetical protein
MSKLFDPVADVKYVFSWLCDAWIAFATACLFIGILILCLIPLVHSCKSKSELVTVESAVKLCRDPSDDFLLSISNTNREEALSALVMLGFTKNTVEKILDKILKDNPKAEVGGDRDIEGRMIDDLTSKKTTGALSALHDDRMVAPKALVGWNDA